MTVSKKEIERFQLDRFVEVLQPQPWGEIVDGEEPDFTIKRADGTTLGIELTDLFWKPEPGQRPYRADEVTRHHIAETAQKICDAKGLPALQVFIFLDPTASLTKRDVPVLGQVVANIVAANVPESGCSFTRERDGDCPPSLPAELLELNVHRLGRLATSTFQSMTSIVVGELERGDIERPLHLKEPKLRTYRNKCDEAWLLICFNDLRLSTYFEWDDEALAAPFTTDFDRVFIWRQIGNHVNELRLQRPTSL